MNPLPAFYVFLASAISVNLLSGCMPGANTQQQQQVTVELDWFNQQVDCQQAMTIASAPWQMQFIYFYLSDFRLNEQPLPLQTTQWQQSAVALLGSDCSGNSNWQLLFAKPLAGGKLSFTLGLPFTKNHQNPLTAMPPLNHDQMFWNWQAGYKFLRLDLQSADSGWAFHLGSTGCQSASVLRPPTVPCRAENTYTVTLDYQPGQHLQLDLATLLQQVSLRADDSCMSDTQQANCQLLFNNLAQAALWKMVTPARQQQGDH